MYLPILTTLLAACLTAAAPTTIYEIPFLKRPLSVQLGPRPFYLVDNMSPSPLKSKLESCSNGPFKPSILVMGHRGAPLQFPEHTRESYMAAVRMGAATIECDVTFTSDKELVCRHSQCDLHTTTNILQIPELAAKCSTPFTPYDSSTGTPAGAQCCTSDITLSEFKSLCAKMDGNINPNATSVSEFLHTPNFRTDLYATCGTLMTHKESIELIDSYGLMFTPECKTPMVPMPYQNWTQEEFAQAIIDDYKTAGISPSRVWPQSFLPDDIHYWLRAEPSFGKQAVALTEEVDTPEGYANATAGLAALAASGVQIVAPPIHSLLVLDSNKKIVPSEYALKAKELGLKIVAWSFERSGPLEGGGGYYYSSVSEVMERDGDMFEVLDVLVKKVGIFRMFSDWPGTVTYYANCMGL